MGNTTTITAAATVSAVLLFTSPLASADKGGADYTKMTPEALAEHLIFEAKGFKLDQPTQEGTTVADRQKQDAIQKACSGGGRATMSGDAMNEVIGEARGSMKMPAGGLELGDWKAGAAVARSGYGFRVGHKSDDHSGREPGGNCYACHQMDPDEIAYGTLGPSLTGFGKMRGNTEATRKYLWEVVYNPHAYFPCTHMPRFGHNGVLTEQQIKDVMAYLLDPASPVNQ